VGGALNEAIRLAHSCDARGAVDVLRAADAAGQEPWDDDDTALWEDSTRLVTNLAWCGQPWLLLSAQPLLARWQAPLNAAAGEDTDD
jgi:hypothetical protein